MGKKGKGEGLKGWFFHPLPFNRSADAHGEAFSPLAAPLLFCLFIYFCLLRVANYEYLYLIFNS